MRNNYRIVGNVVFIELNRKDGSFVETKVSLCDLERLLSYDVKWCLLDQGNPRYYVMANDYDRSKRKKKTVRLHRFLLNPPDGYVVNHIDGDGLNNTRDNLEIVTNQQNTIKRVRSNSNNTSGVRGVSFAKDRGKWEVKFKKNYKTYHFGRYSSKEEAEKVATTKFRELFKDVI
jgi:hypothetical protein